MSLGKGADLLRRLPAPIDHFPGDHLRQQVPQLGRGPPRGRQVGTEILDRIQDLWLLVGAGAHQGHVPELPTGTSIPHSVNLMLYAALSQYGAVYSTASGVYSTASGGTVL
jgi:hypothetical protein